MPLYEYICESCGRTLEAIQSYSEPLLTLCDRCGGPLRKLLSAPAVQFKGSGWYVSDYGKAGSDVAKKHDAGEGTAGSSSSESKGEKSEPKGDKGESKSEAKSESKAESKSETKSETKSESKPESKKTDAA